jgi:hypothetical protein
MSVGESTTLQELIDRSHPEGVLMLPNYQEFRGPVVIKAPLTVFGNGATIWALRGPVVLVDSANVTLKNLNIEVTGETQPIGSTDNCAVQVSPRYSATLEDIQVCGSIIGVPGEEVIGSIQHQSKSVDSSRARNPNASSLLQHRFHAASDQILLPLGWYRTDCRQGAMIFN